MNKKLYEFVTESNGVDYNITFVQAEDAHKALIQYCKYTGEINAVFMEAICSVSFYSALAVANNQLYNGIIDIHEVGNTIYTHPNHHIETIEESE